MGIFGRRSPESQASGSWAFTQPKPSPKECSNQLLFDFSFKGDLWRIIIQGTKARKIAERYFLRVSLHVASHSLRGKCLSQPKSCQNVNEEHCSESTFEFPDRCPKHPDTVHRALIHLLGLGREQGKNLHTPLANQ